VPTGLTGDFTAKLTYDAAPFKATPKDATFTIK
jgi:hypothetical protein